MESPFADADASLAKEPRFFEFRKESFEILYHYYVCNETGEQFTTAEIDVLNQNQVHNKYREKFGVPFVDEIREIREKYELSAAKMSEVLGLGANVYRNYEAGEMPSVATGRLIRLAGDPKEFCQLLEMSKNALETHEYERVKRKVDHAKGGWGAVQEMQMNWLFGTKFPNLMNGYRVPSLKRIGNMVRYFACQLGPYTTVLNKLMFYADFGHFKKYGQSISGLQYKAIQLGPVPEKYRTVYDQLLNAGYADVQEVDFGEFTGEKFIAPAMNESQREELEEVFSEIELETLKGVADRFMGKSRKEVVEISHQEEAWRDNVDAFGRINFEYSFDLKNIG